MNLMNLKSMLKCLIQNRVGITPMLWGAHGLGKSEAVAQVAREIGYKLVTVILSQREPVDLLGMLYIYDDAETGTSVTSNHPPVWFAQALAQGNLIIFLDEFNMARREMMSAAFQLILDRELNGRKLPDSVFIVCAGNPDDERYDVTPMSESLRDRLMHIKVTSDADAWLAYARSSGGKIHPDVVKYISTVPQALRVVDAKDAEFPVEIKHSARSWERVGRIHALPLDTSVKLECIRGIVGLEHATAFMRLCGTTDLPLDALEILSWSKQTQQRLAEFTNESKLRLDLLNASVDNLVRFAGKNVDECTKRFESIKAFVLALPNECAQSAITQLFEIANWSDLFLEDAKIRDRIKEINEVKKSGLKKTA